MQGLLQRLKNFVAIERETSRDAFRQIPATDIDFPDNVTRKCGANFLLDTLRRCIANQTALGTPNVGCDGVIKAVAPNPYRLGIHNTIERDDGNLSGATTDIHNHRAHSLVHGQSSTNGRSHRLFN